MKCFAALHESVRGPAQAFQIQAPYSRFWGNSRQKSDPLMNGSVATGPETDIKSCDIRGHLRASNPLGNA